ncbi:MAG TPA: DUF393 domain-containing protein [Candidatus Dormibacteraeota bacterium]
MSDEQLLVIFDGTCGFCTWCVRWLRRRDHAGRVLALPSQAPGLAERQGLTQADVDHAAWAIEPGGRRFRGAAAVNRALAELPGPWKRLAGLYRLPPVRWAEDAAYIAVARSRPWLSSLTRTAPECDEPGIDCAQAAP